ncbi:MAG: UPF0158 family protein [Planctomycetota bacterium]|nr:UPF0158 family protein [Planctomycetota bacterium]MDA1214256.1 UPF0158 family protein [Planctomycetota bacterium]
MPLPVSLKAIVEEMDMQFDESQAYINKVTGELVTVGEEEMRAAEDGEDLSDFPEWQQGAIKKAASVLASDDYLQLPDKFDIHEYEIMQRFCWSVKNDNVREELKRAISGKGAFRYFKDTIHQHNIADNWYRYRNTALEEIAAGFLEAHGIPFTREDDA